MLVGKGCNVKSRIENACQPVRSFFSRFDAESTMQISCQGLSCRPSPLFRRTSLWKRFWREFDKQADKNVHIGFTSGDFKSCDPKHCKAINNDKYQKETEVSKHIW